MISIKVPQQDLAGWLQAIASEAQHALAGAPPMTGAVMVAATFHLRRPKSAVKHGAVPTVRPTVQQLQGLVLGGLNHIAYTDASQVTGCVISKDYAPPGEPGLVEIMIMQGPGLIEMSGGKA